MDIQVTYEYVEGYFPTRRHRKLHYRNVSAETTVTIPETTKDEAPMAFYVYEKLNNSAVTYRLWNDQLWKPVPWNERAAHAEGWYPVEELLAALKNVSTSKANKTSDEAKQEKHDFASRHLIVDGVVYEQTNEPRYVVMTFGLGHNHGGTSMFIEDHYNPNVRKESYFNALERNAAIAYGKRVAAERGDTTSVDTLGDYCIIQVLIPECVLLNPREEHGEGNPILNRAEAVIIASSTENGAALGLMAGLLSEKADVGATMNRYANLSKEELLDKLEELAENKESAPHSEAYDDYCEEISALKRYILSRINV